MKSMERWALDIDVTASTWHIFKNVKRRKRVYAFDEYDAVNRIELMQGFT